MTELSLRLQVEGNTQKTVKVNLDRFTVGRSPECDLHLPFFGVSRRHAQFTRTSSGTWEVEDLNGCGQNPLIEHRIPQSRDPPKPPLESYALLTYFLTISNPYTVLI